MWRASPLSSKAPAAEIAINRCSATKIPPRGLGDLQLTADIAVFAGERDVDAAWVALVRTGRELYTSG